MNARAVLDGHPVFDPGILRGFHLLESDAGTGKTWTIAGLVVRALLERELDIDRILVVTFTNAATAELAARIRERIASMARLLEDAIAGGDSPVDELFCVEYLPRVADRRAALGRLRVALSRIDEAAVRTIHGFCQRVIDEFGLTTGLPGGIEVGPGDGRWIDALVAEWWRRHVVSATPAELALLADSGASPHRVAKLLRAIHANPAAVRCEQPGDWRDLARRLAGLRERLAGALEDEAATFLDWIRAKGSVDGKRVGGTQHVAGRLRKLRDWCAGQDHGAGLAAKARVELAGVADRLSLECLEEAVGGRPWPRFELPAICSELLPLLRRCGDVAAQLANEIWAASEVQRLERRSSGTQIGFDELLAIVHDTLADPIRGPGLAQALRERYPLALVDECQDTDSLQWQIFRRIHLEAADSGCGLVLVGDPKQAIYAFRGADVYSYLEARRAGPREHALRENQRSVPGLVAAVNALFARGRPFGVEGIDFVPAKAGLRRRRVLRGADDGLAPLTVFRFAGSERANESAVAERRAGACPIKAQSAAISADMASICNDERARPGVDGGHGRFVHTLSVPGEPMSVEQASRVAVAITAGEIARLLGAGIRLDDDPLQPADVAVLVDSHQQATRVKQALALLGIGAVEISRDSVLASAEAFELMRWLAAIADPADAGLVRSALVTALAGLDAPALEALASVPGQWNDWIERFGACRDDWPRHGAHAALRELLFAAGVPARLAGLRDGERRLTNLLHLIELIAEADEAVQGPRQALRWLVRQQAAGAEAGREAQELRLDSDENLVRILTVHKSKGLEFPFVFLPFAWQGRKTKAGSPLLHHVGPDSLSGQAAHWQPVLELGERPVEAALAQAAHESATESVRRLYVALTRAEQRCCVLWGPVKSNAETPLGRLLGGDDPIAMAAKIDKWREAAGCDADGEARVAIVDRRAPGPAGAGDRAGTEKPAPDAAPPSAGFALPEARVFEGRIGRPWIRTSFSAIVARAAGHPGAQTESAAGETEPRPDRDQVDDRAFEQAAGQAVEQAAPQGLEPAAGQVRQQARAAQLDLPFDDEAADDAAIRLDFPAGARAGACLHAILEHAAFDAPLERGLVAEQLQRAGFGEFDAGSVAGWLDAVIDAPLIAPDGRRVALRGLRPGAVLRELDFHLSARGVDERELFEAVASEYPLESRSPPSHWDGFLRGFVDMVFERDGRWYVLDWKSNRLGSDAGAYDAASLDSAMSAHAYSIQACLYLLVLHRLLRQRLPGYEWERHVGGAFWVFLRGVQAPAGGQRSTPGVHASKPSRALIERLDRLFDGAAHGGATGGGAAR